MCYFSVDVTPKHLYYNAKFLFKAEAQQTDAALIGAVGYGAIS